MNFSTVRERSNGRAYTARSVLKECLPPIYAQADFTQGLLGPFSSAARPVEKNLLLSVGWMGG